MPTIIACYKWVIDEEELRIDDDLSVDFSRARAKISGFDRSAIEAAVQLSRSTGDTAVTLTYGTDVQKSLKDALSRGPERGYWIESETQEAVDARATAKVLAAAVKAIDEASLVICAEGASDTYARQVGPRLGVELGWPALTSVLKIEIDGNTLRAVRKLDDSTQTVEAPLPAVVSVLPEGFEPRAPGLKAIMAASKKPKEQISLSDLGVGETPLSRRVSLAGYSSNRKNLIIAEEDPAVAAKELIGALRKEGVV